MNLDDMLTIRNPKYKRKHYNKRAKAKQSKAYKLAEKMRYIVKKVKTGDVDLDNKSHAIQVEVAQGLGILDKDMNILIDMTVKGVRDAWKEQREMLTKKS